jgi:hypothetical protein
LEQICGGSRSPPLIHIHIYHSIQTPQGANISRGKWEGQIIFLGVNIYPYHPNSAIIVDEDEINYNEARVLGVSVLMKSPSLHTENEITRTKVQEALHRKMGVVIQPDHIYRYLCDYLVVTLSFVMTSTILASNTLEVLTPGYGSIDVVLLYIITFRSTLVAQD